MKQAQEMQKKMKDVKYGNLKLSYVTLRWLTPDLFGGPRWQGLGLRSFTSSAGGEKVGDGLHVQQGHNRYLGEHQWGKNKGCKLFSF